MQDIYFWIVALLFILAVSDLIVGVSNDAVNFLNSAIGSKVASFRTILIVASLGILIGATFSSGIMEVARKGIFNPQFFTFSDIIIVFLAVMLTDVILLDLFNTLGLPTSTTVSIVFELLGASVAVAFYKTIQLDQSVANVIDYINTSQALTIILGIFLSVGVAFTLGWFVQYVTRVIYSFDYQRKMKRLGGVTGGIAVAALTYFMFIKGLKGASFISDAAAAYISSHTLLILGISFVVWTIVFTLISYFTKVNIFRVIVLLGTFALAMAFAGNDLVNFIGVPIAGMESYFIWGESGLAPDAITMEKLAEPVRTNTWLLLGAGLIMATTLWLSKKARSVTETEVNLGRQDEGLERFKPNNFSRILVRSVMYLNRGVTGIIPKKTMERFSKSFNKSDVDKMSEIDVKDRPAFDMVRASVNLTVASVLIAFATSLKLPLSTTYVSFMVAMGTSLADRAWGRESAVYRVSGVVTVVLGWFMTALIAFTAAFVFASLLWYFDIYALAGLVALVVFLVVQSSLFHRKKEKIREAIATDTNWISEDGKGLVSLSLSRIGSILEIVQNIYNKSLKGLVDEDRDLVKVANQDYDKLVLKNRLFQHELIQQLKSVDGAHEKSGKVLMIIYDLELDLVQTIEFIARQTSNHLRNLHPALKQEEIAILRDTGSRLDSFLEVVNKYLKEEKLDDKARKEIVAKKNEVLTFIEGQLESEVGVINKKEISSKNASLFLSVLLETKDIIAISSRFVKILARVKNEEKAVLVKD